MGKAHPAYTQVAAEHEGVAFGQVQRGGRAPRVDIPPWYLLDGVTGLQVARPYNPVDDRSAGGYSRSHLVPSGTSCVRGGYAVTIDHRLVKIRGGKIHSRARWTENLCQALYDGWAWSQAKRMSSVQDTPRLGTTARVKGPV